jgi:transketolase
MRSIFESTVLYPSDANQTAHLVALMAGQSGISYIRTTREKLPVIYSPDEKFEIGGSKVVKQSDSDKITIVGAGITLHEAMKAAETLAAEGINVRVIDLYSIKPVDKATLHAAAKATGTIVTVEDHWPEGGVGDAVLEAFTGESKMPRIVKLAVTKMPGSGKPYELLADAGIDAAHIVSTVKSLVS